MQRGPALTESDALEVCEAEETHAVLLNAACLYHIFTCTSDELDLARAASVCTLWREVLQSEDIWKSCYIANHGVTQAHEALDSYRHLSARHHGLLNLRPLKHALVKGTAVCHHAPTGSLVAFSARQRLLSIQSPTGVVRSSIVDEVGAATADKPLLVATAGAHVVLAAFDGVIQVWDVVFNRLAYILGSHHSFITSMAADGDLLATTCSSELRLWSLTRRSCVYRTMLNTAVPVQVEPKVALCASTGLLALANHTFPSTTVRVLSAAPGSYGAPLQQLAVNAASDVKLHGRQLLVASCFQGRGTGLSPERPFTVVVHCWDTKTWECTRRVSPRLWTNGPSSAMHCMPLIHATQDLLLCCVLNHVTSGDGALPFCGVYAWRLQQQQQEQEEEGQQSHGAVSGGSALRLTSRPRVQGSAGGGAASAQPQGGRSVMVVVSDEDRDAWQPVLDNTKGIVTTLFSSPTALVLSVKDGSVYTASIPHMATMLGLRSGSSSGGSSGRSSPGSGRSSPTDATRIGNTIDGSSMGPCSNGGRSMDGGDSSMGGCSGNSGSSSPPAFVTRFPSIGGGSIGRHIRSSGGGSSNGHSGASGISSSVVSSDGGAMDGSSARSSVGGAGSGGSSMDGAGPSGSGATAGIVSDGQATT